MATLNWQMITAARDLWEPRTTLTQAMEQNPEYVRSQVEIIAACSAFEDGDDSEDVQAEVGQAIFCRWSVVTADYGNRRYTVHVFDTEGEAKEWAVTNPHFVTEVAPAIDPR